MKKRHQHIMDALFGYALMAIGVATIVSCFLFYLALKRSFRSDELTVILGSALVLLYLGYYIAKGEEIPLPSIPKGCVEIPEPKLTDVLDLYKISDENHRFYVDKRFTIISLYIPAITATMTGVFLLVSRYQRVAVCAVALVLSIFLYFLENRNWVLSNVCAKSSRRLGLVLGDSLHHEIGESWHSELPESQTWLDRRIEGIASFLDTRATNLSQHGTVFGLTVFLIIYWIGLALCSIFGIKVEDIVKLLRTFMAI